MTIPVVVNLLLGASLLSLALLLVAACYRIGLLLMWCDRRGVAFRWPDIVRGGPSA